MYSDFFLDRAGIPEGITVKQKGSKIKITIKHDQDPQILRFTLGTIISIPMAFVFIGITIKNLMNPAAEINACAFSAFMALVGISLSIFSLLKALLFYKNYRSKTILQTDNNDVSFTLTHLHPDGTTNSVKFNSEHISTKMAVSGYAFRYSPPTRYLKITGRKQSFYCYSLSQEKTEWLNNFLQFIKEDFWRNDYSDKNHDKDFEDPGFY